jgi:ribonuclease HI
MKEVDVFTDGACSGNPGPGGWGAILRWQGREREMSGGDSATTNNRMEMTAVIEALRALREPCRVAVHTDSKYVMEGATRYLDGWKRKGWKTADKSNVKNVDLWLALEAEMARHEMRWIWVRGHDGHAENERADALARGAIPPKAETAQDPG